MLKKWLKRAFVFFIVVSLLIVSPHFRYFSVMETFALPSSVSVKGTSVNVRSGPGTSYKLLGTVALGYKIRPIESASDVSKNGKTWYKFSYNGQDAYIRSDFCKELSSYIYDAQFEADMNMKGFPESYKAGLRDLHANYPNWVFNLQNTGLDFQYVVSNELVGTRTLVNAQSISSFKSTDEGKYDYVNSKWPTFDGGAWVCASKEVTECFLDPRNFLYDPYVFQFELQTFNTNFHTLEGIQEMVKGTFLDASVNADGLSGNINYTEAVNNNQQSSTIVQENSSNVIMPWDEATPVLPFTATEVIGPGVGIITNSPNSSAAVINSPSSNVETSQTTETTSYNFLYLPKGTYSYSQLIYHACAQVNVNPYVVVSMILQEQGKDGSDSVSGTNKKYKGYYNYGNINAFASGSLTAIENGLKYASESGSYNRPWNTKEKGIYGLCDFYANSYVKGGQDTFYLKKWNVQGQNMFKHQYMTNVAGAASEGQILGNAYDEKMLQMPHEFKIPVYNNMPETNCPMPTKDGSPNNRLKSLSVNGYVLTPTFDTNTSDYSIIIDNTVDSVFINAEAFDTKAAIGGIGNIRCETSNTIAIIYCVAENKDIRQYNINIYKKGAENVAVPERSGTVEITFPTAYTPVETQSVSRVELIGPGVTNETNFNSSGASVQVGVGPG